MARMTKGDLAVARSPRDLEIELSRLSGLWPIVLDDFRRYLSIATLFQSRVLAVCVHLEGCLVVIYIFQKVGERIVVSGYNPFHFSSTSSDVTLIATSLPKPWPWPIELCPSLVNLL